MATQTDKAKQQSDETIERIGSLNEQVLQAGRDLGQGFLEAYEQTRRTFADFHQGTAEGHRHAVAFADREGPGRLHPRGHEALGRRRAQVP